MAQPSLCQTNPTYYSNLNELIERLELLVASRHAGNTGLDNEINGILDELRRYVSKEEYIELYKKIF